MVVAKILILTSWYEFTGCTVNRLGIRSSKIEPLAKVFIKKTRAHGYHALYSGV